MKYISGTIWRYNKQDRCWQPKETKRCMTRRKAVQWALSLMPVEHVTRYTYHSVMLDWAEFTRQGGRKVTVEQPKLIVPSVGERGYW